MEPRLFVGAFAFSTRHRGLDDEVVHLALDHIASGEERIGLVCVIVGGVEVSRPALGEAIGGLPIPGEERTGRTPLKLALLPVWRERIHLFQQNEDHGNAE